jgi:hypothetical protein
MRPNFAGSGRRSESIIAGHEVLGHAYPRIMGWPSDEQNARQVENLLRQQQGLPLRDPNSN